MMGRLSPEAVVSHHQLLDPADIVPNDWRLFHVNERACREMVAAGADVHFVTWPDCAVGFVYLPKADAPDMGDVRAAALQMAYAPARDCLEWVNLQIYALVDVPLSD